MGNLVFKDQEYLTAFNSDANYKAGQNSMDYPNISVVSTNSGTDVKLMSRDDFINSDNPKIQNVQRYDYIYTKDSALYRSPQNMKDDMVAAGYTLVGICLTVKDGWQYQNNIMVSYYGVQCTLPNIDNDASTKSFYLNDINESKKLSGKVLTQMKVQKWIDNGQNTINVSPNYNNCVPREVAASNYEIGGLPKGTWYVPSAVEADVILKDLDPYIFKKQGNLLTESHSIHFSDTFVFHNSYNGWNDTPIHMSMDFMVWNPAYSWAGNTNRLEKSPGNVNQFAEFTNQYDIWRINDYLRLTNSFTFTSSAGDFNATSEAMKFVHFFAEF